jgi:hypothetical protein
LLQVGRVISSDQIRNLAARKWGCNANLHCRKLLVGSVETGHDRQNSR